MTDSPPAPAVLEPEPMLDPEIQALLDFEPVPRRNRKERGWSAEMQRQFIAELAVHGSPTRACNALQMYRSGVDKLARCPGAEGFRAAWYAAIALAEKRRVTELSAAKASAAEIKLPFVDHRKRHRLPPQPDGPLPGQQLNEYGEYEDEGSIRRRAEDARDNISRKLINCRRLYLMEISGNAGKRAAFEMLTELPIDWDRASRLEAQVDEPWRKPNMRKPDMLLTAENGWMGAFAHGPDKMAELRREIDRYREEEGLPAVDWDQDDAEN